VTVDLPIDRTAGFVADPGEALSNWVGEFLAGEGRRDVRDKLRSSGAEERHVFLVMPGFATAEFAVVDLLMRDNAPLPLVDPNLPHEVSHVWAASTWTTDQGIKWSPIEGWTRFEKRAPQALAG
jgi:hypothetical protein